MNALVVPSDPLQRSLLGYFLRRRELAAGGVAEDPMPPGWTLDDLLALGASTEIDAEVVESRYLGQIDGPLAQLTERSLRSRAPLTEEHRVLLLRATLLSHVRSPAWKRDIFPRLQSNLLGRVQEALWRSASGRLAAAEFARRGLTLDEVFESFHAHQYHWELMREVNCDVAFLRDRGVRVSVLHSPPESCFVTSDNASRVIIPDLREWTLSGRNHRFEDQGACALLPLGPDICACLSIRLPTRDSAHVDVSASFVRRINTALLGAADRFVVMVRPDLDAFEPWVRPLFPGA